MEPKSYYYHVSNQENALVEKVKVLYIVIDDATMIKILCYFYIRIY